MADFKDLFDSMEPGELDELLEGIDSPELDKKAERRVLRRALRAVPSHVNASKRRYRILAAAAACLAVVCLAGLGGHAYALELEYNEAAAFFDAHDLDTRGLTKSEVRQVYRDITTNSFTCSKTAEVLDRSAVLNCVPGFDISGREPTPEELRAYWESITGGGDRHTVYQRVTYRVEDMPREGETATGFQGNCLEKYEDGELLWRSSPITIFAISGYKEVSDGVIVYGIGIDNYYDTIRFGDSWLTKLDENGQYVWTTPLLNGFTDEDIRDILELEDGTLAVFSGAWERVDGKTAYHVCLTRLTPGGKITYTHSVTPEDGGALTGAARLGDGYLAVLGHETLLRLDADGEALGYLSYDVEGKDIVIRDLLEYNGQVYLSAYCTDRREDGGREIEPVLDYINQNSLFDITSEELTPMVRELYSAMLLICDPETGRVSRFYASQGCLGGELGYGDGGELLWDMESIAGTYYSPATNAFTIGGKCDVYRCAFSPRGELLGREPTGESVSFAR